MLPHRVIDRQTNERLCRLINFIKIHEKFNKTPCSQTESQMITAPQILATPNASRCGNGASIRFYIYQTVLYGTFECLFVYVYIPAYYELLSVWHFTLAPPSRFDRANCVHKIHFSHHNRRRHFFLASFIECSKLFSDNEVEKHTTFLFEWSEMCGNFVLAIKFTYC